MRNNNWSFTKHIMLSAVVFLLMYVILFFVPLNKAASSIGIIGGADGPTAIYITGSLTGLLTINKLPYAVFAILLLLYRPVRKIIEKRK